MCVNTNKRRTGGSERESACWSRFFVLFMSEDMSCWRVCSMCVRLAYARGWRERLEREPFEISNSMRPYPSVFHAYTSKLRPVIFVFEPNNLDEASSRIPPTSHAGHSLLRCCFQTTVSLGHSCLFCAVSDHWH